MYMHPSLVPARRDILGLRDGNILFFPAEECYGDRLSKEEHDMSLPTVAQRAVLAQLYLNNQTQSNYPVCRRHAILSAPSDKGIISKNRSVGKDGASDDRGLLLTEGKSMARDRGRWRLGGSLGRHTGRRSAHQAR
jgi:hypothetical protein